MRSPLLQDLSVTFGTRKSSCFLILTKTLDESVERFTFMCSRPFLSIKDSRIFFPKKNKKFTNRSFISQRYPKKFALLCSELHAVDSIFVIETK